MSNSIRIPLKHKGVLLATMELTRPEFNVMSKEAKEVIASLARLQWNKFSGEYYMSTPNVDDFIANYRRRAETAYKRTKAYINAHLTDEAKEAGVEPVLIPDSNVPVVSKVESS